MITIDQKPSQQDIAENQEESWKPGEIIETILRYLSQNQEWKTDSGYAALINYSAEDNKTWGTYFANLKQFLDLQETEHVVTDSKAPETEESGKGIPGSTVNGEAFAAALFGFLEYAAKQAKVSESQNKTVSQYLNNNFGLDIQDVKQLLGKYLKQNNTPLNTPAGNLLHSLGTVSGTEGIQPINKDNHETNLLQSLQSMSNTGTKAPSNIKGNETGNATQNKSIETSEITRFFKNENQHAQRLSIENSAGKSNELKEAFQQWGQNREDTSQVTKNSYKGPEPAVNHGNRVVTGKNNLFNQNINYQSKISPESLQNSSLDIGLNVVEGQQKQGLDKIIILRDKTNESFDPNYNAPAHIKEILVDITKPPQRPVTGNQFVFHKTPNSNEQATSLTSNVKEINVVNKDTQNIQQIQLHFERHLAPITQQSSGSHISQQVQLAARVAPLIQQAISNNQGTTSLRLKLKPEYLGEVTVRLIYNQGNLQAHFIAANAHARELLDQTMVHLKESLQQLNINLNDATTSSGDENNKWGQQSSFQQKQHNTRENESASMPPEEFELDEPLYETDISENRGLNHLV